MYIQIKYKILLVFVATFTLLNISMGQTNKPATNYMAISSPIVFDGKAYILNWSSHPATNFYKQEYLLKEEVEGKYKTMVLIDAITGKQELKDVVSAKVSEIIKMKESNPLINYETIRNPKTGEYMLDFIMTANANDGSISIIERNVYRYRNFTDKAGNKSVMLFGVSSRAYGADAANQFLISLKRNRKDLISKVAQFKIPDIKISK